MPYTISSKSSAVVSVGGYTVFPGSIVTAVTLNSDLVNAFNNGYITISPNPASVSNPLSSIVDDTTGTVSSGGTLVTAGSSYTAANINDNFALLAAQITNLRVQLESLISLIENQPGDPAI